MSSNCIHIVVMGDTVSLTLKYNRIQFEKASQYWCPCIRRYITTTIYTYTVYTILQYWFIVQHLPHTRFTCACMHAHTHIDMHNCAQTSHLLMDVLRGKNTWCECVCVCFEWVLGVTALGNHTPSSTHQGTSVSLWFCPVPLPALSPPLLLTAEIGQPHIMEGQWGASMRPPHPVPLHSPTRYLSRPATESKLWPPMDTQRLAAERQAQPATTCRPPSHNSHLHSHAWTERILASHMECAHSQDKFAPMA